MLVRRGVSKPRVSTVTARLKRASKPIRYSRSRSSSKYERSRGCYGDVLDRRVKVVDTIIRFPARFIA